MLVILFLILVVIVFTQSNIFKTKKIDDSNKNLAQIPTITPSPTVPIITKIPTSPLNIVSPTPQQAIKNASNLFYPNAHEISSDNGMSTLESSDDPDTITNWYKDLIKNMGMNTKSFVQTKTNGNILNKLVGSNATANISVEISKSSADKETKIIISTNTY